MGKDNDIIDYIIIVKLRRNPKSQLNRVGVNIYN
jgi:hypothetical protein